jgi:Zn-dependent protease
MNETIRLGTFAGVRVGMNWSVLAIVALLAFGLAGGRLPAEYPGRSGTAYLAAGLATAVAFMLSLLAHEVGHAVVARRNGIEVDGITLWLFGGIARLRGEAADPGAELRIAGVGPLVSVVLGIAFGALEQVWRSAGLEGLVLGAFGWLGPINLMLAVFNLVPAAPLDGGRVLRAVLWRWRGDRFNATITASRVGVVFGFTLVGLGLAQFAMRSGFGGLWSVLIGWFLINAARGEEAQARVRGSLAGVRARDVMTAQPLTVPGSTTVEDFLEHYVLGNRYTAFPITDGTRGPSLVTLNRVRGIPRDERRLRSVREVACPPEQVATASPDEPLADVLPRMSECADGRVLVVDDGEVVGIISPSDVARRLEVAGLGDPRERTHV